MSNPSSSKSIAAVGAPVPMLDLKRQYVSIRPEVEEAIARVCESQQLILGDEAVAFEREASSFLGVAETIACGSGTDALWLMMQAAGIGAGDSVITTPFSFFASASAIVRTGARPVFVDIDPATLNLDPVKVEEKLQDAGFRVKGILPVHLYGQCARMDRFADIAAEHKLMLFEDAAQAFGATWRGKRAGNLGLAAAFSFYPTKNLSAFGDAGCVTTNDTPTAARVRSLRNHGSTRRYYHDEIGWNARMDAIQAAVLRIKLKRLPEWNAKRRELAANYDKLLVDSGLTGPRGTGGKLDSRHPMQIPATLAENVHIFHQYVIRADRRDELRKFLSDRAIGSEIYYPAPLHLQRPFTYLGYLEGDLPEAERAAKEVLALPMFPELTEEEQKRVVGAIAEFYS
ncbi:MAG: DegT/DnrJ/EryC1/StrS family aminotransferase [Acidobacteriaceae bacterium]